MLVIPYFRTTVGKIGEFLISLNWKEFTIEYYLFDF